MKKILLVVALAMLLTSCSTDTVATSVSNCDSMIPFISEHYVITGMADFFMTNQRLYTCGWDCVAKPYQDKLEITCVQKSSGMGVVYYGKSLLIRGVK